VLRGKSRFVLYSNCAVLLYVMWQMTINNPFIIAFTTNLSKQSEHFLKQLSSNNLRDVIFAVVVICLLVFILDRFWRLLFGIVSIICIVISVSFIYEWYTAGQSTSNILMFALLVISLITCKHLSSR
jgi:hypothetical protein